MTPEPESWKREREEAKKAESRAVEALRSDYQKPKTLDEALASVQQSISSIASAYGYPGLNFANLGQEFEEETTLRKREAKIRKTLNELYKLRHNPEKWIKALAVCYLHTKLLLENPDPGWKIFTGIKRLLTNLKSEKLRPSCIALLYYACDIYGSLNEKITAEFKSEIDRLFLNWHSDIQARDEYERNCERILRAQSATDKHFILNGMIPYLEMRYKLEPALRKTLIQRCEEDIGLYRTFLAEFNNLTGERKSFEQVRRRKDYFCPRLPSFDALWYLYADEGDKQQLERLRKIASDIRYPVEDV